MTIDPEKLLREVQRAKGGPRNSCMNKLRAATEELALQLAQEKGKKHQTSFRPYHCNICGDWHLTSEI